MSRETQLILMTPGILLKKLGNDPMLKEYTHVLIDEVGILRVGGTMGDGGMISQFISRQLKWHARVCVGPGTNRILYCGERNGRLV